MDFAGDDPIALNPLDAVEDVVRAESFAYERIGADTFSFVAPGGWCDHEVLFSWSDGAETLHLCLGLDVKPADISAAPLRELLALLNERMWFGHFDVWPDDKAIVYRSALPLPCGAEATPAQIASMIAAALEAGERFYPSYTLMERGGKTPNDAVAAAIYETAGEA